MMSREIFIDCNSRTLDIFGCEREDIVGATPYRFSPPNQPDGRLSKDAAIEHIDKALAGKPQLFEWRHNKLDGTQFMAQVSLNGLQLGDEKFVQAIVRVLPDKMP